MTFLKKSLAVLLAVAMMIGTMSVAASAWTPAEDGNELTIVHVFYRYDEATGEWVETTKAAPGEKVKLRAFVTTDYYTNSLTASLFFDNRFFTMLDEDGEKPDENDNFTTVTNKKYLGLKATDNNSQWYSKNSNNFVFTEALDYSEEVPNIINGELVEVVDPVTGNTKTTVPLRDYVETYNVVHSVIYFASSPYNTKLDGTDFLYEYNFEVNNTNVVKTPGNLGTVCLPEEVACNADYEMLYNFPKGPASGHEDEAVYMGNGWTPEINNNIATISVFNDVILDANGGTFGGAEGSTTFTLSGVIGEQVTGISANVPVKPGFAHKGWSLTPDGAVLSDAELAELKYGYEEKGQTLYAVWSKTDTFYTVELYEMLTDGTYGAPISKQVPAVEGTKVDYPAVPQTGFHFDETQENVTSIVVSGDNKAVVKVYYARDAYTATFHFTDETGERTDAVSVLYGAAIPEFSAVPGGPIKEGYKFKGWSTDKDKLVAVPTSMPAEDVDLFPIFEPIVYTYYFDADGGKLLNKDNEEVDSLTHIYMPGDKPEFPADPVKPGYEFIEWNPPILPDTATEDMDFQAVYNQCVYTVKFMDGEEVVYQTTAFYDEVVDTNVIPEGYKVNAWTLNDTTEVVEFPYTVTDNVIFRATDDALVYDAIFYLDDGVTEYDRTQAILYTEVKAPAENPTKYGYDFVMWDPMVEGAVMEEGGLKFYATFEIADFEIIFYDEDGETELRKETKTFGDSLADLQKYVPTKEGYTFQKWSKDIPAEMPGEDVKVVASWLANDNIYNFYDVDGTTLVNYISAKTGAEVTLPAYPSEDGYEYTGWVKDNTTYAAGDKIDMVAGGGSFTAVRELADVTITLNANGGILNGDETITAKFGEEIDEPAEPTAPEGSKFIGWSTSATGKVVDFPETMPAKDVTYYAIWETNKHLATFDGNGVKIKGTNSEVAAVLVEYGAEIPFPELEENEGYLFKGWTPATTTMPNEPVTFVAQWEYVSTGNADYTIYIYTVNPANPSEYIETIKKGTTKSGDVISIVADGATTPDGTVVTIDYEGLNLAESNVPDTANANNVLSITAWEGAENNLVAYFKLATFTATFDIGEDATVTDGEATVTGTWGTALTAPTLDREGWTHTGWTPSVPSTLKESATYTAVWEQISADAIFTIDGEEFDRETYNYGDTIVPPTAPAKPGYTFAWNFTEGTKMGEDDVTISGAYTSIDYSVSYIITENKPGATVPAGETGKHIDDEITLATPEEKNGYTFEGWVYNNATYAPGTNFTMPAANVVFSGKYAAKTFDLEFKNEGGEYVESKEVKVGDTVELPTLTDTSGNKTFLYWTDGTANYPGGSDFEMPAKDTTLEAVWDTVKNSVTVDYTGEVPEGFEDYSLGIKEAGKQLTLPEFPEAEGYTFDGWYIDNAKYGEGATFTMPNTALTVVGKWTKDEIVVPDPEPETAKLILNANGGKFDNGNENFEAEIEVDAVITTTPGDPDRDGYRFAGWVDANGSASSIPGKMPAEGVNLTAVWKELFDVSYDVDGADYGTYPDAAAEGDNLPAPTSIPKKDGFIFDKWVDADTKEAVTSMPAKDLVLVPTWTPIDPIEFSLMYFDGTTALGTQTYKEGDTIVPMTAETKPGYTFNGWKGMPADLVMPAEDLAVFADYTANKNSITLDANGGKFEDESLQFTSDVPYDTVLSTILPANPTRDGYTFNGWVDAVTGEPVTLPSTMPDSPINVKADWTENAKYTLTVEANGGKFTNGTTSYDIVREENKAIGAIEQPTREGGYTFKEWKIEAPAGVVLNSIPDTMPPYNFKIVAQWNDPVPDKYVVTVNPNGGTFPNGTTGTWTSDPLEEGAAINNLPGNPEKDGYEFKGWLESTTGNVVDNLPTTAPAANTVYTAQWEKKEAPAVESHKINYYLVKGGALYDSDEYEEGAAISFITPAANDIKGFKFIKWVDVNGNDIAATMGTSDIDAYAVLEIKKYTVTYMSEGKVVFQKTDVPYGSEVPVADAPASSNPNKVFSKWTPEIPAQMPDSDLTFTAEFIDVEITKYKATFFVDGKERFSEFYAAGETIKTPKDPVKLGYKFVGWDPAVPGVMPEQNLEFNAVFEKNDSDSTVIIGGAVIGGAVIGTLAGINAALITGAAIVGGIIVIVGAAHLAKHTFTVTYMVDGEVYKTYKVVEGTKIPVPATPTKDGAEFAGWNPEVPEKMPGNDLTFEATWGSEIVEIPNTGSIAGVAAFATISAAAAAAYVIVSRKKNDEE